MRTRSLTTTTGRIPVDPMEDEIVLRGYGDRPSIDYLRREHHGQTYLYAWRPAQRAYGEDLREVCEEATPAEIQEVIHDRLAHDGQITNAERLHALGFRTA